MAQIARLTLWDVNDLFDYWRDHPPTHVLVAAYLMAGSTSHAHRPRRHGQDGALDELKQAIAFAGGGMKGRLPKIYH